MNQLEYETKMLQFAAGRLCYYFLYVPGWYGADGQVEMPDHWEMKDLNKVVDYTDKQRSVNPDKIGATGISYGGGQSLLGCSSSPA
jgi:dipeptidyl aminopeptidase/acylaminoacyl peptidase